MDARLIYDVGVNDGSDTAYYLRRGFKVVGIEASPLLAENLRARFSTQIASGDFVLLNVGVAAEEGQAEFWMSDLTEWSSFDRRIASRNGMGHRAVTVPTRPFGSIVAENGVGYYCKIDIEGHDRYCLTGLTPQTAPRYISIEMLHRDAGEDLRLLKELGYTKYKVISQVTRCQPWDWTTYLGYAAPRSISQLTRRATRRLRGVTTDGDWRFAQNSSGAFAEDTPGPWRSHETALRTWKFLRDVDQKFNAKGLGEWFDIHATR